MSWSQFDLARCFIDIYTHNVILKKKRGVKLRKGYSMLAIEKVKVICENFPINTLYLFGSFADGSHDEDSDLDFAYLTVNVENDLDYGSLYFDLQGIISRKLDLVDLRKAPLALAFRIIKDGKVIYDLDEERRTDFEDELIKKYLDFSTFSRLIQEELDGNFMVEVDHDPRGISL